MPIATKKLITRIANDCGQIISRTELFIVAKNMFMPDEDQQQQNNNVKSHSIVPKVN